MSNISKNPIAQILGLSEEYQTFELIDKNGKVRSFEYSPRGENTFETVYSRDHSYGRSNPGFAITREATPDKVKSLCEKYFNNKIENIKISTCK
jgi:hypothetical protein